MLNRLCQRLWLCCLLWTLVLTSLAKAAPATDDLLNLPSRAAAKPAEPKPNSNAVQTPPPPPAATPAPVGAASGGLRRAPATYRDHVKAVPHKALFKRHRLELAPNASMSLTDPYYLHFTLGGSAVFYVHDNWGIGVGGDYFLGHVSTTNVSSVRQGLISVPAVLNPPSLFLHGDAYWVPIYGKLTFYDSALANFDVYVVAGAGFSTAFAGTHPLALNVGIGEHYACTDWLAVRLELRDYSFVDTALANNIMRSSVQNYLQLTLGVSFFVPPSFEYTTP